MGHGPRYNVRDGGFARILCCTIKINPMSVDFKRKREYDEKVQKILSLLKEAYNLSQTMCKDVGRGSMGWLYLVNTLTNLYFCIRRMNHLLNAKDRYEKK